MQRNSQPCHVDFERVRNAPAQFQCIICLQLCNNPQECMECGALIGCHCLNEWVQKKSNCPQCRSQHARFKGIKGAFQHLFQDLDIKCRFQECDKYIKLYDLQKHEASCQQLKCDNFEVCNKLANPIPSCSLECELASKIKQKDKTPQKIYENIQEYKQKIRLYLENEILQNYIDEQNKIQIKDQNQNQEICKSLILELPQTFRWSFQNKGSEIELTNFQTCAVLAELQYVFKTIIADKPFESGVHYWEIIAHETTENEMKIGVMTKIPKNLDMAFCDTEDGFAFYGLGQLRNGSNGHGQQVKNRARYGKKFLNQGRLGILLDMNKGCLYFGMNGECWGLGFTSDKLKMKPIYPAAALLHRAGCTIDTNAQIPPSFKEFI